MNSQAIASALIDISTFSAGISANMASISANSAAVTANMMSLITQNFAV